MTSQSGSNHHRVPEIHGFVRPGFEEVRECFRQNLHTAVKHAGSFAAYYHGELVVNLWVGYADQEALRPWRENTLGFFFSTTKSAAAIVIAHLVDRGLLNYEDKIAKHWPDFAQNGKEEITLKMLLSHQAGLAALDEEYCLSWLRDDPARLTGLLTSQRPLWKPGTQHGYHPMTFGLYLDQIVRRVDEKHRSLSEYFKEEIAEPFNIDFHIGLPKPNQHRMSRLVVDKETIKKYYRDKANNFSGNPTFFLLTARNVRDWTRTMRLQDPDFMELPCPSSHGVGTAQSVARLHAILATQTAKHGRRLLSPRVTELLQKPLSWGLDVVYGLDGIYSYGMSLLPVVEDDELYFMFGGGGFGGQYGAADSRYGVGWAYLTSHLDLSSEEQHKPRWVDLCDALYRCIHRLEKVTVTRNVYRSFSEFKLPPSRSKL